MRIDAFDFDLPEERIALRPARPRDAARLLVVRPGVRMDDAVVSDLPRFLRAGDALVVNDTKVIAAELAGVRHRTEGSVPVHVTLHHREDASTWRAFARPARRLRPGDRINFGEGGGGEDSACLILAATVLAKEGGEVVLRFDLSGPFLDEAIALRGSPPLPPYIASKRAVDARDRVDYQTVYARTEGAVAAPTAGLHITERLIAELERAGISFHRVTLHVGAGTFLPVKSDSTDDHHMHAEWGQVTAETAVALNEARQRGGRIVAVGTTSLRLLESAADESDTIHPFAEETAIFIKPGYRFRAVDLLLTNFHLPKSTLFMLVSAFSGLETMQAAYRHAIDSGYRFYSYGDACLLHPEAGR